MADPAAHWGKDESSRQARCSEVKWVRWSSMTQADPMLTSIEEAASESNLLCIGVAEQSQKGRTQAIQ